MDLNDGLCSNLSLVMGVAGAAIDSRGTLVAGLAAAFVTFGIGKLIGIAVTG